MREQTGRQEKQRSICIVPGENARERATQTKKTSKKSHCADMKVRLDLGVTIFFINFESTELGKTNFVYSQSLLHRLSKKASRA